MLKETDSQFVVVTGSAQVIAIRRIAKEMAEHIGFNKKSCEEIALVVSELATNIIKYAQRGVITLTPITDENRQGLTIEATDNGPGFEKDIALKDGVSTKGTLGFGLGAVNRMMDEFEINTNPNSLTGTKIVCKRWMPKESHSRSLCPFETSALSRPKPGEDSNGDAFVIKYEKNNTLLVAVIDGVGHGARANEASKTAKNYVEAHSHLPIIDIFKGVERACKATRGVVMAIALLDWDSMTLAFGSVGNIEVKVLGTEEKFKFLVRRGILGKNAPNPAITHNDWHKGYVLALHSDGLSTRWSSSDFSSYLHQPAKVIAENMLQKLEKSNDDATLVIVK